VQSMPIFPSLYSRVSLLYKKLVCSLQSYFFFLGRPFPLYKVMVIPDAAQSAEIDQCFRQCNLITKNSSRTLHQVTSYKIVDIIVTCKYVSLNCSAFVFMCMSLCPCVRNYEQDQKISYSVSTTNAVAFFVKTHSHCLMCPFRTFRGCMSS
jgi:hypothetical protein